MGDILASQSFLQFISRLESAQVSKVIMMNDTNILLRLHKESSVGFYAIKAVLSALIISFALVSVIGNLLVSAMFARTQSLRTSTNYFITSMAVSDLLYGTTLCGLFSSSRLSVFDHHISSIGCKTGYYVLVVSYSVSIVSLVLITVDKFIAVVFPMKVTFITGNIRAFLISTSWMIPAAFCFPFLYFSRVAHESEKPFLCVIGINENFLTFYTIFAFVFLYILPFLLIITLNIRILKSLRRSNGVVFPSNAGSSNARTRIEQNQRITKILVSISVFFFFCWTAHYICIIILKNFPTLLEGGRKEILFIFLYYLLPLISTAFNPTILFVFSTNYRRELKDFLGGIIFMCKSF